MTTEYKNDAMPRFDLDDSIEEGKGEESDDEDEEKKTVKKTCAAASSY